MPNRLTEAQMTVRGHTMGYNIEGTIWLGIYLDIGLQFWPNKNISLEKAKKAEDRVRRLESTYGLESELIRQVLVTVLQAVAFYGAEILWHAQNG